MDVRFLRFEGRVMQAERSRLLVALVTELPESYIFTVCVSVTDYKLLVKRENVPSVEWKSVGFVLGIVKIDSAKLSFTVYMTVITYSRAVCKPILVTDALALAARVKLIYLAALKIKRPKPMINLAPLALVAEGDLILICR